MLDVSCFTSVPAAVAAALAGAGPVAAGIQVPSHEQAFACSVVLAGSSDKLVGGTAAPLAAAGARPGSAAVPAADPTRPSALAVALREERSDLGAGLVEALWFERPVILWLPCDNGGGRVPGGAECEKRSPAVASGAASVWRVEASVWRCCIAGPLFSEVLAAVRASGEADVASAWELRVRSAEQVPAAAAPGFVLPSRAPREELHLDVIAAQGGLRC